MAAALLYLTLLPHQAAMEDHTSAEDAFCGARALKAVLDHLGRNERFEDLVLELGGIAGPACSMDSLRRAFQRRGISCRAIWLDPESLAWLQCPAIIHLSPQPSSTIGHFVALVPASTGTERLVAVDPAMNSSALGLHALQIRFSGAVLLITDDVEMETLGPVGSRWPFDGAMAMLAELICLLLLVRAWSWPRLAGRSRHLSQRENNL